jgi:pseudaminic acid cytidylyltransferase
MKIIAIIPARDNSKRIKNKNLLKINNKPILEINYNNLKKTKIFDKIILSSESNRIQKLSKKIGFDLVINRPKNLSKDDTSTASVISHAIKFLADKIDFTHVCCIYPMAILIGKNDLLKAKQIIKKKNEIIFPALKYSHPIQRAFKINKNSNIKYNISHKLLSRKTQSFSEYFHDAGQFYLGSNYAWKNFIDTKKRCFKIKNDKAIDVDNYDDFEILKAIYNFKK